MIKFSFKISLYLASICLMSSIGACKKDNKTTPIVNPPILVEPPVETAPPSLATIKNSLVDKNATDETAAMYYNMQTLSKTKVMFGHQDDTMTGYYGGRTSGKSDVNEVTGTYPAVFGWDFLNIASFQRNSWFDIYANDLKTKVIEAYNKGAINTFCWHYWNPVLSKRPGQDGIKEGKNEHFYYANAKAAAVAEILPSGAYNSVYKISLDQIADFIKTLKGSDGKMIPIIFRPYHEFDGDWFWWGEPYCTPQEYKDLFQYTVKYLRDEKQLHNILFAWSPDNKFATESQYLARYPGDDFVDVLGTDNYGDLTNASGISVAVQKLKIVSDYAKKKNKLAALTETGLAKLSLTDWYTQVLLKVLQDKNLQLSYAMTWGNDNGSFYTPYKGHPAEADFLKFKNTASIVFADNLPAMYKLK